MNFRSPKTLILNISYILGWVIAAERGFVLWYLLITTILMVGFYHKQLWKMMKLGGDMYAEFCRKTSKRMVDKVLKDK